MGVSGAKWAPMVHQLAGDLQAKTVLDYGSGKGTLKSALLDGRWSATMMQHGLPYEVFEYDPAIAGKTEKPASADLVVCGDVLEHIEPDCLEDVLDDLRNIAQKAVFLVVATRPAKKVLSDGRNAHLIVERSWWWLPKILSRWELKHFTDFGGEFLCVGVPL
jgi:hypothetical protein